MNFIQAIILGFIQGVTEFIPISSSGHLVLIRYIFGWEDHGIAFDVVLHLGTFLAVVLYFRKTWARLAKSFFNCFATFKFSDTPDKKLLWYIVIATIPAAVIGFFAEDIIDKYFRSIIWVASFFIFTGIAFFAIEKMQDIAAAKKVKLKDLKDINFKDSLIVGFFQLIALLPGISRSGMTMSGGMFRNLKRETAAKFSFLISAPVILGAGMVGVVEIFKDKVLLNEWYYILIGFLVSAIFGYLSIAQLLKYLKKDKLNIFAYYLIGIGIILLILNL